MKILLTNDDGIQADGLASLVETLATEHKIAVVAPDSERSATGHSVTIRRCLKPVKIEAPYPCWSLDGTPADCVKLALHILLPWKPDFLVSGINRGVNVGVDVLYSGTVAGALEGAALGCSSIAVSVESFKDPDYPMGAKFVKGLLKSLEGERLPPNLALNVNLPGIAFDRIKGVLWTKQVGSLFRDKFEIRPCPDGGTEYVLVGEVNHVSRLSPGSDAWAVRQGYISITPLGIDLTSSRYLPHLYDRLPPLQKLIKE